MMTKKIAMVGCGALGKIVAANFEKVLGGSCTLAGVHDLAYDHAAALAGKLGCRTYQSVDELLADTPDITVEIAGIPAVQAFGEQILTHGSDLVIVSVGALADQELKDRLVKTAASAGRKIYVVNGAIGGFDIMQTVAAMGALKVGIESTKAPKSLNGAPYLEGRLLSETEPETVFVGDVVSAIRGFPKNVNVAVATSQATGFPDTQVAIKSEPSAKETRHRIHLEAPRLEVDISICSTPDPENPRSSVSTAWSVLALLKNLTSPLVFF